ncbi:MAG: hypothetical protein NZM12_08915 [Steroidobacteraceae bacterium]|nr:hypothetical protein [Steroidobacteraceae bacterium]
MKPRSNRVRRWPYPYWAAVSISNDSDFCRFDYFEAFMQLCNTLRATPLGSGLGIEVTSSFFFFSDPGRQFGYFAGLEPEAPLSEAAPRLADYITAGWLDANHAYGDFDGVGGFRRAHAERCFAEMSRLGADIRVFINHGDEKNTQCIGAEARHHFGDLPGDPAYHADLLTARGPTYVTSSAYTQGHVTDRPEKLSAVRKPSIRRWLLSFPSRLEQELLAPLWLRDGSRVTAFWRVRGTGVNAPNLSSLTYQVRLLDLEALYASEGVAVIYQHWGVLSKEAGRCVPASIEAVRGRPELLSGLRTLAREYHEGRLWVSGLQRLLDYCAMIGSTEVREGETAGTLVLDCRIRTKSPLAFFQGLTIYVDPTVPVKVTYDGVDLPLVQNGPDQTGRYSVSVPLIKKPDIW